MPNRVLEFLAASRTRQVVAWLVLLAGVGHRGVQAWINFRVPDRPDRNDGHTSIDFGGQWMMGRLLILGHGRDLYSRPLHLEIAREAYPRDREPPHDTVHDAERLISWYQGPPDDPIGGPLYPPVHAFVMAPFAAIPDPYVSYRVAQYFLLVCALVAGAGICYLTRGRWWFSAAASFVLWFPGCRGGIDLAQNSPITAMLLIWGWAFIVRGRPSWGGLLWGLLAFKPVWAISFLAALLLLQQWRAAFVMAATGAALAILTLPFVGIQVWFDWLHVGKHATATYMVDRNWIFLSRDLFGIPRRMFLEFQNGKAIEDRPIAGIVGWALWGFVAWATIVITIVRRKRTTFATTTGPLVAFVMLGAWLCTYRFMYYDALIAIVAVVALMADPKPFFRRSWWPLASWSMVIIGLLFLVENVTSPLNVEVTASVQGLGGTVTAMDRATHKTAPTFFVSSGDDYPWDTVVLFALWIWCAIRICRRGDQLVAGAAIGGGNTLKPHNSA